MINDDHSPTAVLRQAALLLIAHPGLAAEHPAHFSLAAIAHAHPTPEMPCAGGGVCWIERQAQDLLLCHAHPDAHQVTDRVSCCRPGCPRRASYTMPGTDPTCARHTARLIRRTRLRGRHALTPGRPRGVDPRDVYRMYDLVTHRLYPAPPPGYAGRHRLEEGHQ